MNFVLSRESPVPLRAQLSLQVEVAIVTGQFPPGKRLPSVRDLARRLGLHHNTVAAAYADLAERGLVESKRGSGLFVSRRSRPAPPDEARELDELIASFLEIARGRGYSGDAIRVAVAAWLAQQPPDHVLLVEPAPDVRAILEHELAAALDCRVESTGIDGLDDARRLDGALVVTSFYHSASVRERVGPRRPMVTISLNPGSFELDRLRQLPVGSLLGIVSVSPILLATVGTVVASIRGEDVLVRLVPLSDEESWRKLARTADAMICDSLSGERVARVTRHRHRVMRLIPESTLDQLRAYFTSPAPDVVGGASGRARPASP
jgi:GntR family transcriptional regulator